MYIWFQILDPKITPQILPLKILGSTGIYIIYVLESADAKTVVDLAADLIHVYLVIAIYNYCIVME